MRRHEKAIAHLRTVDPALAKVIKRVGPYTGKQRPMPNLFHALCQAISYQQLSGKAAETIFGRFMKLAGDPLEAALVAKLSDEQIRACGLSRPKLAAIRDLAAKTLAGELPHHDELHAMPDELIIERLTAVRGIGRWTAEMILMFRLGRPDVLPVNDLGIQKGFKLAFNKRKLPSPEALAKHGQRWAPYRSYASWYLWRVLELPVA
jgi:3-methyladenine DNA glycosylase/8-oxoguanine DNA glycosylase